MLQKENKTIIEAEISSFKNIIFFFIGFIAVVYVIIISLIGFNTEKVPFFAIPFVLIHGTLIIGIPWFVLRKSTSRLKKELEKDFYFMIRK